MKKELKSIAEVVSILKNYQASLFSDKAKLSCQAVAKCVKYLVDLDYMLKAESQKYDQIWGAFVKMDQLKDISEQHMRAPHQLKNVFWFYQNLSTWVQHNFLAITGKNPGTLTFWQQIFHLFHALETIRENKQQSRIENSEICKQLQEENSLFREKNATMEAQKQKISESLKESFDRILELEKNIEQLHSKKFEEEQKRIREKNIYEAEFKNKIIEEQSFNELSINQQRKKQQGEKTDHNKFCVEAEILKNDQKLQNDKHRADLQILNEQIARETQKLKDIKNEIYLEDLGLIEIRKEKNQIQTLKNKLSEQLKQLKDKISQTEDQLKENQAILEKKIKQLSQVESKLLCFKQELTEIQAKLRQQQQRNSQNNKAEEEKNSAKNEINKQIQAMDQRKHLLEKELQERQEELRNITAQKDLELDKTRNRKVKQQKTNLFVGEAIQEEPDKEYLLKILSNYNGREVKRTKLLYAFPMMVKLSFHQYVDDIPNFVIVVHLKNNYKIAFYSQQPLSRDKEKAKGQGFLASLTNKTVYQRKRNSEVAKTYRYDPYYMEVGNQDLRIVLHDQEAPVTSIMGNRYAHYEYGGARDSMQLLGTSEKETQAIAYQVFQLIFE